MTLCTSCKNNDVCVVTNMDAIRGDCIYYTPKTNADRIRAGSNEHIAGFVCTGCPPGMETGKQCTGDETCYDCWLDWLQSPAGGECE